jgi:predicted nucleic acid-binding protein
VRTWVKNLPLWLEVRSPTTVSRYHGLGPGEAEAIALAAELDADLLLIDERDGTAEAKRLGLNVTGTLGVLDMAA